MRTGRIIRLWKMVDLYTLKFPLKQLSFFKILIPDQDFFELNCINLQIGVAVHIYIKVHKV